MEKKHRLSGGGCTTAVSLVSYAGSSLALWQHTTSALSVEAAS